MGEGAQSHIPVCNKNEEIRERVTVMTKSLKEVSLNEAGWAPRPPTLQGPVPQGWGRGEVTRIEIVSLYPTGAGVFGSLFAPDWPAMSGWQALECRFLM